MSWPVAPVVSPAAVKVTTWRPTERSDDFTGMVAATEATMVAVRPIPENIRMAAINRPPRS